MLESFYSSINEVLLMESELNLRLKLLRDLLKSALSKDEFRLNCVEKILDTLDNWKNKEKGWDSPHFFYHEKLKYSVRIIFWPVFYENNPHKHKTWSVTGVFHNQINVNTYEMLENPNRLKKQKTITAGKEEVGYLLPGCIHNVSNPSHELSASIHIFNNISSIDRPEENAIWYPSPKKHNLLNGAVDRALLTCLAVIEQMQSQQALKTVSRIYHHLPSSLKLNAIRILYRFDAAYAKECFNKLENTFFNP